MKFIAVDFETSGLEASRHAPVSLTLALFEGGEVTECREFKIGRIARREYDVCALQISGTTWPEICKAPSIKEVMQHVSVWVALQRAEYLPIVAFNAAFDHAWYRECLFLAGAWEVRYPDKRYRTFFPPLRGGWFCPMTWAQATLPHLPDYKLDTVAAHFGLARESDRHGAAEDAILCGKVAVQIASILGENGVQLGGWE